MPRAAIFLALVLICPAAMADGLPALSCTCDAGDGSKICPGFLIRFRDGNGAQIARMATEPKWSRRVTIDVSAKQLTADAYGIDPELGHLTIDRESGRYSATWVEAFTHGFDGWVSEGGCRPLQPQADGLPAGQDGKFEKYFSEKPGGDM